MFYAASQRYGVVQVPVTVTRGDPQEVTLTATADTYVNAGAKTTAFGGATTMLVDGTPDTRALLRFELPPPALVFADGWR